MKFQQYKILIGAKKFLLGSRLRKIKAKKIKRERPGSDNVRSKRSRVELHKALSDVCLLQSSALRAIHLSHSTSSTETFKALFPRAKLLFLHKRPDQRFSHRCEPHSKSDYFQWNPPFSTCQLTMSVPLCLPWKSSPFWYNGGWMCIIAFTAIYSWWKEAHPTPTLHSFLYFFFLTWICVCVCIWVHYKDP